jgi:hypothetical protein
VGEEDEIVRQLQEVVRQHQVGRPGPASQPGVTSMTPIAPDLLDRIHATVQVNPHVPIAWPAWPKGVWPKLEAMAQKVIRRSLRWYVNPIVAQQNAHNLAVNRLLVSLCSANLEQGRRLAEFSLQLEELRAAVAHAQEQRPPSAAAGSSCDGE